MPRGVSPRQPAEPGVRTRAKKVRSAGSSLPAQAKNSKPDGKARVAKASSAPSEAKSKGYNPVAPERVAEILKRLNDLYPEVTCALTHASAWELLVATILSAQSTDVNVNRVTPEIFRKYPTVAGFCSVDAGTVGAGCALHGIFPE